MKITYDPNLAAYELDFEDGSPVRRVSHEAFEEARPGVQGGEFHDDELTDEEAEDAVRRLGGRGRYDRLPTDTDVSLVAVAHALGEVGLELPVLHVSSYSYPAAVDLAEHLPGLQIHIDPRLGWDEWFVSYGGRRVGSPGA